uniref:UDP-glucose/GDP-mannose dehydrogenase C-terminal domain-containing protein n=1 Tax=Lotharella globosa TaxID=91324 RepID=A0A7S3YEW7_9EUKA
MIKSMFNTISGKKIVILGFAFKKDTGDTRETAAVYVAKHLLAERAKVTIYDPKVEHEEIESDFKYYKALTPGKEFKDCVSIATDPYEAVKDAHAIAIMTEWDEFKGYDYKKMYDSMAKPAFIFDGRLILDHKKLLQIGFEVYAIGKPYGVKYQNMDDLKAN